MRYLISLIAALTIATPAVAQADGLHLHQRAEHCSQVQCDFPTGGFYRALTARYDRAFPEDQAGALRQAYAIDARDDRRAAVRLALSGRGY